MTPPAPTAPTRPLESWACAPHPRAPLSAIPGASEHAQVVARLSQPLPGLSREAAANPGSQLGTLTQALAVLRRALEEDLRAATTMAPSVGKRKLPRQAQQPSSCAWEPR